MDHPDQPIYQLRTINVMRVKRIAQTRPSWVPDPQNLWGPMNGECFKQLSLGAFCSAAINNWYSSFYICRIESMVGWCCGPSHMTCFGKWKVSKCDTSRRLNSTCKTEVLFSCTFTNAMRRHSWDRLLAGGRHGNRAEVQLFLSSWSSLFCTNEQPAGSRTIEWVQARQKRPLIKSGLSHQAVNLRTRHCFKLLIWSEYMCVVMYL